jgi:membrane glycosyltransferase
MVAPRVIPPIRPSAHPSYIRYGGGRRHSSDNYQPLTNETVMPPGNGCAWMRRLLFGGLVLTTTVAATVVLAAIFSPNGLVPLEGVVLILFAILFLWISTSFWTAFIGYCVSLRRGVLTWPPAMPNIQQDKGDRPVRLSRTALIMPIYNEDVSQVFARVRAIHESLVDTGESTRFDIYVLSDTTDPETWIAEEVAWNAVCCDVRGWGRIFYRHRPSNKGHKSGNIADFCRRWGYLYDYMVVLDADSLMSGETLVELVRRMDLNPRVGLIQTPPTLINGETLFARFQQFAASVYGPIFMIGAAFWHLSEGNYWGHNAIIRVSAFMRHCGLPELPRRGLLGGEILSHDFVEAALLRRAGWQVWLATDLTGSFEEPPATLTAYAKRDRRWCQGNLQHLRLILARGFHPMSRLHLAMGVMSYLSSPLWFLFLLVSALETLRRSLVPHDYFLNGSPFPSWPASYTTEVAILLAITLALLFIPKVLGFLHLVRRPDLLAAHGGTLATGLSVALESFLSVLIAPILMVLHTQFVISILLGYKAGWIPHQRTSARLRLRDAIGMHAGHTGIGLIAGIAAYHFVPNLFWWLTPVLVGPVFAIPLSLILDNIVSGQWMRRWGIFRVPTETTPPSLLLALRRARRDTGVRFTARGKKVSLVMTAIVDPFINALHILLLQPEPRSLGDRLYLQSLTQKFAEQGLETLLPEERKLLLSDADSMLKLHAMAWRGLRAKPVPA